MDSSDELYDSLENVESIDSDVSKYVPLYDGEIRLDEIKPKKRNFNNSKIPIKCDTKSLKSKGFTKGAKTTIDLIQCPERNSYVSLFRAKNSKFKKPPELNETARAEIGDFTQRTDISGISSATYFSDARSTCSDTTSFYLDVIKKMENGETFDYNQTTKRDHTSRTLDFNLQSVSEFSFAGSSKSTRKTRKDSCDLIVPHMGGLGPDLVKTQEKLSRLQKQKTYGQKASDHNRIRILEIKVLKGLKEEGKNTKT